MNLRRWFDPEFRRRLRVAKAAAEEADRRKQDKAWREGPGREADKLAASPLIEHFRAGVNLWGYKLVPGHEMDATACFWFRRGLEGALKVLDDVIAAAGEGHA